MRRPLENLPGVSTGRRDEENKGAEKKNAVGFSGFCAKWITIYLGGMVKCTVAVSPQRACKQFIKNGSHFKWVCNAEPFQEILIEASLSLTRLNASGHSEKP